MVLTNRLGLHARAAARLVRLAKSFRSSMTVSNERGTANACSILDVLAIAAGYGSMLRVNAEGADEVEALAAVQQLIADKFGEE